MEGGMAGPNKNEIPFPPIDLIKLVTGGDDVSVFDGTGAADLDLIRRALAEAGFNPKSTAVPGSGLRVRLRQDCATLGCRWRPNRAVWMRHQSGSCQLEQGKHTLGDIYGL